MLKVRKIKTALSLLLKKDSPNSTFAFLTAKIMRN